MPAFVSHYIHAKSVEEKIKALDPETDFSETAFSFGAQGPDFLFSHKVWLTLVGGDNLNPLGSALHQCNTGKFFGLMKEYYETQDCDKDVVLSYIYGFLCHYALDRNTHPLIYAIQAEYTKAYQMENVIPFSIHNIIEFNIDTMLLKSEFGHSDGRTFNNSAVIPCDEHVIEEISKLMAYVVPRSVGHQAEEEDYKDAFHHMIFTQKVLYDPKGIKRGLLNLPQKPLMKVTGPLLIGMLRQKKCDSDWDYMNLTHKEWAMVYAPEKKSTASFMDLYRVAQDDAIDLVKAFRSENASAAIEALTGNMSYDTGLPFDAVEK